MTDDITIGIDGNEANVEKKVGVSVYSYQLIKYFHKQACKNIKFIIYLKNKPRDDMPEENEYFLYKIVWGPTLWRDLFLPLALYKKPNINIFFSPAHYTPRFCQCPLIVTIHDLSYLYFQNDFLPQDLYKLKNWTKHAVNQAKKIIAVSKFTKEDIIKQYKIEKNKIYVVYNGCKIIKNCKMQNLIFSKYNIIPKKYLLYVGTLQPRKNILCIIRSFSDIIKKYPQLKLVIAGKKGWLYKKIFENVNKLGLKQKVIFTGYIENDELACLYKNAFCFVLASLYEGFGITVTEAMGYGCPVIVANTSSLPEITGGAGLLFNPYSPESLTDAIITLLKNENLRNTLIKKGIKRAKLFDWQKCAEKTLKILINASKKT